MEINLNLNKIYYKAGYKYQLSYDYNIHIPIFPKKVIITDFISLTINGYLTVRKDYAWDGPSGPTIDTKSFMRGSLVHDVLYQLIREGLLPKEYRERADELLGTICLEDGMLKIRAWWVYRSVRRLAGFAANPKNKKEIIQAP